MNRWVQVLVILALAALVVWWGVGVFRITNNHDFEVQYQAAERLRAGENIYADSEGFKAALESGQFNMGDDSIRWPYANPPLLAILTVPLTFLSYDVAAVLWTGLTALFLLAACAAVLAAIGRLDWVGAVVALVLLYGYYPATVCLRLGQVEILLFLLIALAFLALKRGRDEWAGAALGIATAIKFFPGALILFLAWKRKWKAAAWGLGVAAAALGASVLIAGPANFAAYTEAWSVYAGGAFSAFPLNQSLNGFFSRLFRPNIFWPTLRGLELPGLATGLWLGSAAVLGAALAWFTRKPVDARSPRFDLEFGAAIVVLLLAQPHSQVYAFVWLLLPLIVVACRVVRTYPWSWLEAGVLLVAYFMLGRQWFQFPPIPVRFVRSHVMFGTLLLAALVFYILGRKLPASAAQGGER
ncbi:MAG: glycosyltransferase family 87 protein [Anaerolineae bacterium]